MSAIPRLADANGRSGVSALIRGRSGKILRDGAPDRTRAGIPLRAGGHSNAYCAVVEANASEGLGVLGLASTLSAPYPRGCAGKRLTDAMPIMAPR